MSIELAEMVDVNGKNGGAEKCLSISTGQPRSYSLEEIQGLRDFIKVVKDNDARSELVCWGNYDDYTHGW